MTADLAAIRERQEALMQDIGAAMLGVLPVGWRRADLMVNLNAGVQDTILTVYLADRSTPQVVPPPGLHRSFMELRRLLYRPGRGTWFAARVSMDAPGRIDVSYNFDHDPMWNPPLLIAAWARDQEVYPRDPELIPDWLRDKFEPHRPPRIDRPAVAAARRTLDAVGQNAVAASLSTLLVHSLPGDWSQLFVAFRAAGSFVETRASVLNVFGQSVDWRLPDRALPWFLDLRAGMYRDGQGTWTSARFHLAHPNVYSVTYDWHGEPAWTHRPAPRYFLEELELFPRSDDNISNWLRERAGLPARPPVP